MLSGPIDALLDEFDEWAEQTTRELGGDYDEAALLLQLAHDYLDVRDPAKLTERDLEELLLEVYPRTVTVRYEEDAANVIATVRDLLAFLGDTGRTPAKRIKSLERAVDRIEPRFLDTFTDSVDVSFDLEPPSLARKAAFKAASSKP